MMAGDWVDCLADAWVDERAVGLAELLDKLRVEQKVAEKGVNMAAWRAEKLAIEWAA